MSRAKKFMYYRMGEAGKERMHCWLMVNLLPVSPPTQVLCCRAAFQLAGLQLVLMHGVISPQVEDFTFLFF